MTTTARFFSDDKEISDEINVIEEGLNSTYNYMGFQFTRDHVSYVLRFSWHDRPTTGNFLIDQISTPAHGLKVLLAQGTLVSEREPRHSDAHGHLKIDSFPGAWVTGSFKLTTLDAVAGLGLFTIDCSTFSWNQMTRPQG